MKIKKSDLKNIIKEELQEELELQEIYIPFIGLAGLGNFYKWK